MIELVFVIVILGVLAAVAVPRFVATRTDAQVATARSDLSSVQKAIVAKVFADNIDTTANNAPDPNKAVSAQTTFDKQWGDWIIEVGGLDGARWAVSGGSQLNGINVEANKGIAPLGNVSGTTRSGRGSCGLVLAIDSRNVGNGTGAMLFDPSKLKGKLNVSGGSDLGTEKSSSFCQALKKSYESSAGPGNKIIPLAATGTVEF